MGEAKRRINAIQTTMSQKSSLTKPYSQHTFYHGTNALFDNWVFPCPRKLKETGFALDHYGVFFTTNKNYAQGAGSNLLEVSLSSSANILDCTSSYKASEELRRNVAKNEVAQMTANINHDFWHNGWLDGSIMRVMTLEKHHQFIMASFNLQKKHIKSIVTNYDEMFNDDIVMRITTHNLTRGFIELICDEARKLKYDGIFGYEIDRWNNDGSFRDNPISQTWLAIFNSNAISPPKWIIKSDL